jgi:hypothetical protein
MGKFHRIRWDNDCPRSVRNVQVEQQILESFGSYRYIPCFCTPYITIATVVTLSHSVCTTRVVNGFFNSRPKTLCLQRRCYSRTDCAPLGTESHSQWISVVGWTPQCDSISASATQLFIDLWPGISSDFSVRVGGCDYLHFLRTHCSGLLEDVFHYASSNVIWTRSSITLQL